MATPPLDSVVAMINAKGLNVGNQVLDASGASVTASKPLYVDSTSKLASGAIPHSVPITPSTSTTTFLNLTGSATADVMTTNFVVDGTNGATTFTKKGYVKISVTDSGAVGTNGDYYIQIGTLT